MRIAMNPSALRAVRWHQYVLRFVLGGLITMATGLVAKYFGPIVGGLFLAFPAIFPAGATLIAQRERRKKELRGLHGTIRARRAAALDGAGTVQGAFGLACFACLVWSELRQHPAPVVLCSAALLWLAVSMSLWWLRKKHWWPIPKRSGIANR